MGANAKELPANVDNIRDTGLIPELGRSPGGGHGNPPTPAFLYIYIYLFIYLFLFIFITQVFLPENPMDRGAWWAAVHRVAENWA